jgi:hypothetical protein
VDPSSVEPVVSADGLDAESREWLLAMRSTSSAKEAARDRLYSLLLRIARAEVHRRGGGPFRITGPELDDVAHQAAADALLAIETKLDQFRGESRFTTWAYKFVMFEVSRTLGRHFWRRPHASMDAEAWDQLPDRFGLDPALESEWRDLLCPWMPWSRNSERAATRPTRCCSTPAVSFGPRWSLTGTRTLKDRGAHEQRLGGTGPVPGDRSPRRGV